MVPADRKYLPLEENWRLEVCGADYKNIDPVGQSFLSQWFGNVSYCLAECQ